MVSKQYLLKEYKKVVTNGLWILIGVFAFSASVCWIIEKIRVARLVQTVGNSLDQLAATREKELLSITHRLEKKVNQLASNPQFMVAFDALAQKISDEVGQSKKEEHAVDQFFEQYPDAADFKDIIFIKLDGTLFYTNKIDLPMERSLMAPSLKESPLTQSFERVRVTLTTDISEFAFDPVVKEPAFYITHTVIKEGRLIGFFAAWIDESAFYRIIQNYDQLGKTGDIFVTKNIGDRVLFIAPSRLYSNVAFKKITNPDKYALTPARKASMGSHGQGLIVDSFDVKIVAAWRFIPQLDWGFAAGIQYPELFQSLRVLKIWYSLLFFVLFCLLLVSIAWYWHTKFLLRVRSYLLRPTVIHAGLWLLLIMGIILTTWVALNTKKIYWSSFEDANQLAQTRARTEASLINQYLSQIEKVASGLAHDVASNAMRPEDLSIRLTRDLKELPEVQAITIAYAPFAHDTQNRLFGIEAVKNGTDIEIKNTDYDYAIPAAENKPQLGWFDKAIKQGAYWSDPFIDQTSKKKMIIFALPFAHHQDAKKAQGVIAVKYLLDKIINHARSIEIGKTGYAIVMNAQGTFIYHPIEQYVEKRTTLFDLAREQNNQQLKDLAEKMVQGQSGFGSYYDQKTELKNWVSFEPIPSAGWTIATLFTRESLDLPTILLHKQYIWLFMCIVLCLLFATMIIAHIYHPTIHYLRLFAVLSSLIFGLALLTFWFFMHRMSYQPSSDITTIRDKANLDKLVEFIQLDTLQRNEKEPIIVPTGIQLQSIAFPDSNMVNVSGYMWQRIKPNVTIKPGIRFPEASESKITEVLRKKEKDDEIIGWNFSATFAQKHRYSWFPFDKVHIDIFIGSSDFEQNVILAPDFNSYQSLDSNPIPGIATDTIVPGFTLEKSFFSFSTLSSRDETGIESFRGVTQKPRLHFNVVLERALINPFIIFFLPLLIILFGIYAIFLATYRQNHKFDVFKSLGGYTGLFLSVVILQQTLRRQYQAGELLYIEYLFFFIYITLLLLILHALLLSVSKYAEFVNKKISPFLKIFFWPIQLGLWFGVTMIIFYVIRS